jgi:F420-0:gamma-glutamyl ligase
MQQIKNDDIFVISSPISQTVSFAEANINRVSVLEMSGKAKKMISQVGEEISSYLFK